MPLKQRTVEENRGFSSLLETPLQTELIVVISRLLQNDLEGKTEIWWWQKWQKFGGGGGGKNRNVVMVEGNNRNVVVKGGGKQQKCGGGGGGGGVNLFKFATLYLFLSLHSAHEELT